MEPTKKLIRITYTIEFDVEELRHQFEMGIRCGMAIRGDADSSLPQYPERIFQEALTMADMVIRRDCQAAANQATYGEGYSYGLKLRDSRL